MTSLLSLSVSFSEESGFGVGRARVEVGFGRFRPMEKGGKQSDIFLESCLF